MATTIAKIRLVRCPKCLKLLPEMADVPMYQCGWCGVILRAKNHNISNQTSQTDLSQNLSHNDSSNAENYCFENQELSGVAEIGESSNAGANNNKETEPYNSGASDISSDAKGSSKIKSEESFKEEAAKPPKLKEKCDDSSNKHDRLKASAESSSQSVDSEERPQSNNLRSPIASSSDDGSGNSIRDKYRSLSRRTVRGQRFSGSFGTKSKERAEVLLRNNTKNTDGGMSLESEAFYSIRSWVESDKEGSSRSLSRRSAFFEDSTKNQISSTSKFKNLELLKLMEELRDQLGRSYELKKNKHRSQFNSAEDMFFNDNRSSQMPLSYFPSSRNKARTSKSYCRPVSGGAPFVICRKCFEVLHMPADFLISGSRLSKLKCGACSEVMVLSFPALTSNEVSQTSNEGPVSFSEEYGISFADTSSMGAEPVLNVSKASSEMNDEEKASAATLHQLMGYPSARVLLFENSKSLK